MFNIQVENYIRFEKLCSNKLNIYLKLLNLSNSKKLTLKIRKKIYPLKINNIM